MEEKTRQKREVELEYLGFRFDGKIEGKLRGLNHRDRITVAEDVAAAIKKKNFKEWEIHAIG